MSLFSAMTTAVSGLKSQASSIATVSNNLSNTSTTSYKAKSTDFEDLVSSFSSSSSSSTGIGATATTDYNNDAQGTIESSNVATYLAISGDGYFATRTATANADGSITFSDEIYYTRDGDFTIDADGYLVNGSGYYLLAWEVDTATGLAGTTLVPAQISELTNQSITTSEIDYAANLPASVDDGETTSASALTIYDSLGNEQEVSYAWEKTDTNTWELTIVAADGYYDSFTDSYSDYTETITFHFDTDGTIDYIDDGGGVFTTNGYTVTGTSVTFELSYDGAATQSITSNFDAMTQYGAESLNVQTFEQNGTAAGSFSNISIDSSGNVAISYDNGASVIYYEIPIATFVSADNLEEISGNAYRATLAAGDVTYSVAGTEGAGTISSNALEDSNVDIATEFSILIQAQQIYSANAKTVSTVDDMLDTIIQV